MLLHKTIKKVTEDIENLHFNTAISQLMIFRNAFYSIGQGDENNIQVSKSETSELKIIKKNDLEKFLIILSPFAPHLAEELWEKLRHKESIFKEKWPEYDKKLVIDEEVTIAIQVNGKLRETIKAERGISEDKLKSKIYDLEKVKKYIEGKEIKKFIYVKDKLVNIVV
jgi:leucyl-tRNA synthetase